MTRNGSFIRSRLIAFASDASPKNTAEKATQIATKNAFTAIHASTDFMVEKYTPESKAPAAKPGGEAQIPPPRGSTPGEAAGAEGTKEGI